MKWWFACSIILIFLLGCQSAPQTQPSPAPSDADLGPIIIDDAVKAIVENTSVPVQEPVRLSSADAPHEPYLTDPPTSGAYADVPVERLNAAPLPPEAQVNALRQGKVVISYNTQNQGAIRKLEEIARRYDSVILNPEHQSLYRIQLTAWGHLYHAQDIRPSEIIFFIESYQGGGPPPQAERLIRDK